MAAILAAFGFVALMPAASADCSVSVGGYCGSNCTFNVASTCAGNCNFAVDGYCYGDCTDIAVLSWCRASGSCDFGVLSICFV
jgi:hypothetical protein